MLEEKEPVSLLLGSNGTSKKNKSIVLMAIGFFFTFAAFNTTQTILSTVLEKYHGSVSGLTYDLGSVSLMVIYVSTCASLRYVPRFVEKRGPVATLTAAGLCYALYITSLIFMWEPLVFLASVIVGFGQAAIWVAQGVVLTASSREDQRGADAGHFWGIYSCSGILGPAVGFFVYEGVDTRGFFLFALGCTLVGANVFRALDSFSEGKAYYEPTWLLSPPEPRKDYFPSEKLPLTGFGDLEFEGSSDAPSEEDEEEDEEEDDDDANDSDEFDDDDQSTNCCQSWWEKIFCCLPFERRTRTRTRRRRCHCCSGNNKKKWTSEKRSRLLKMFPLMFFVGISDAFVNATFPLMFARKEKQEAAVFLVFVGWGAAETFGAVFFSRLSDRLGRKFLLFASALIYALALGVCALIVANPDGKDLGKTFTAFLDTPKLANVSWLAFFAGAAFGLADSLNNTQVFALLGDFFPEPSLSLDAYTAFQMLQSMGLAAGFALSLLTPLDWIDLWYHIAIQLATLLASVSLVFSSFLWSTSFF